MQHATNTGCAPTPIAPKLLAVRPLRQAKMIALACTLALASSLAHAEVDKLVREAAALSEAGQALQAFNMLEPFEAQRAGDPDFDAVLGIAANGSAQHTRAIFALERVLAVQPSNTRARAELGRALFAVGDNAGSRKALEETKKQGAPEAVISTINQFLQAIDRADDAARSTVRTYMDFAIGHDSNVNGGPASASVPIPAGVPIIGGLVLTLPASSVKTPSSFYNLGAGVSGRYVLQDPRWSLIGNLNGSIRKHPGDASQFNSDSLGVNAGAAYRHEQMEYSLVVALDTSRLNGATARNQAGLVGEWTYRLDNFRQLSTYLQWSQLSYPSPQDIKNAKRTVVGSNYAHTFIDNLVVFGGGYLGTEREKSAGVPHLGHSLWGIRAGFQKALTEDLSLFASLGYEKRKFGGDEPSFGITREDKQSNIGIGLGWTPAKMWRVTPQFNWAQTASNIVLNDFSKRSVSVSAKRDF